MVVVVVVVVIVIAIVVVVVVSSSRNSYDRFWARQAFYIFVEEKRDDIFLYYIVMHVVVHRALYTIIGVIRYL